jgi:hypothetical protein
MMRIIAHALLLTFLCYIAIVGAKPSVGMSDADKAVWGASEKVDTSFIVPSSQGTMIMGKAQGLISQWGSYDSGMSAMKIQTVTDSLIETYNPIDIGDVGFNVTRTTLPQGDQISISTTYYTGNIFSAGRDRKDADKRAHLLSYILQVYAKNLSAPPTSSPTPVTTVVSTNLNNQPELPSDLEAYLNIIRVQLSEEKYELALASLEDLKGVIRDKQTTADAKTAPAPIALTPSDVKPTVAPNPDVKQTPAP